MRQLCSGIAENEVVAVEDFIDVGNILGKSWVSLWDILCPLQGTGSSDFSLISDFFPTPRAILEISVNLKRNFLRDDIKISGKFPVKIDVLTPSPLYLISIQPNFHFSTGKGKFACKVRQHYPLPPSVFCNVKIGNFPKILMSSLGACRGWGYGYLGRMTKKALECSTCGPGIQKDTRGGPPGPPARNHTLQSSFNNPCASPELGIWPKSILTAALLNWILLINWYSSASGVYITVTKCPRSFHGNHKVPKIKFFIFFHTQKKIN